jgi:hypothetical protein
MYVWIAAEFAPDDSPVIVVPLIVVVSNVKSRLTLAAYADTLAPEDNPSANSIAFEARLTILLLKIAPVLIRTQNARS